MLCSGRYLCFSKNNAIDLKFDYNIVALVFAIGISRKSAHSHCIANVIYTLSSISQFPPINLETIMYGTEFRP